MRKLELILLVFLFFFCIFNPQLVQSENKEDKTEEISENIKNLGEFLKQQDYFMDISKICHEEICFSIDINDLNNSLHLAEDKMIKYIRNTKGEEEALAAQLKGFSVTKVFLH